VVEALAAGKADSHKGFTFQNLRGEETKYTFAEIEAETARRAGAIQQLGLRKGDRLGMVIAEPEDFVLAFLSALRTGVVPVAVYPPHYLGGLENYGRQVGAVLRSSGARVLVASPQVMNVIQALPALVGELETVIPTTALLGSSHEAQYPEILPDDLAFLQYTSGSTMAPRGVMVTHRSLVSNIRAFMGTGLEMDPDRDSGVCWLPLYHDMGLVGFVLGPLFWGVSVVFIPTLRFIKNASAWLDAVDLHRATVTFAPNFAFSLAARRVRTAELGRWDLSCLKAVGCGSEPIHPPTLREFVRVFSDSCRLNPDALMPAYGLAECTLAVAMKTLGQPLATRLVDGETFQRDGIARSMSDSQTARAIEHVSCGRILSGSDVEILDPNGDRVPEDVEGEVCVRGPSVATGYFGEPEAWARVWRDGWLWTGDLGYLSNGELFITGRSKDLIILNGRNHHPQTIEWMVAGVDGVREGNVVAFSRPGASGEELVVIVEARAKDFNRLVADVEDAVHNAVFTKPADVVWLSPGSLPKTSSGKLKRHEIKQQYLRTGLEAERLHLDQHLAEQVRLAAST
jgi:fatty-acyl-CoA synthase